MMRDYLIFVPAITFRYLVCLDTRQCQSYRERKDIICCYFHSCLSSKSVCPSIPPTPKSPPSRTAQPGSRSIPPLHPHYYCSLPPQALRTQRFGSPKTKTLPWWGYPHCPRHTKIYLGLWKEPYSAHSLWLHLMSLLKTWTKTVKQKH